jgi:hypothetical protein
LAVYERFCFPYEAHEKGGIERQAGYRPTASGDPAPFILATGCERLRVDIAE